MAKITIKTPSKTAILNSAGSDIISVRISRLIPRAARMTRRTRKTLNTRTTLSNVGETSNVNSSSRIKPEIENYIIS